MVDSSRRAFLAGGITVGSVGIAGCVGDIPGLENDENEGDEGATLPSFHAWLYAPESIGIGPYTYTYADSGTITDTLDQATTREFGWAINTVDTNNSEQFDGVDHAVSIDYRGDGNAQGTAIAGGFDPDEQRSEIEDAITEQDNVETTTYASYDVYFNSQNAVAIGDGSPVAYLMGYASESQDATGRDIVEAMIDARDGNTTRLHAADGTADRLLRQQGEQTLVFGAPTLQGRAESLFKPQRRDGSETDETETTTVEAGGFTVDAGDDEDEYRVTVITADAVDDPDAFADTVPILDLFGEPSITQDGVVLTFESGTGGDESDGERSAPDAAFDVRFDRDMAVITQTSGEAIPVDELEIRIERDGQTEGIPVEAVSTVDKIRPGHRTTVSISKADPGTELAIVWTPESTVLHNTSVPERTDGPPQASFDIDTDLGGGTATVTHTGGDSVPAEELRVIVQSPAARDYGWGELAGRGSVAGGDQVTVELNDEDARGNLVLIWTPEGTVLAEAQIETDVNAPSFEIEFDLSRNVGTVRHAGGDPLPADELDVVVEGGDYRNMPWTELSSDETVGEGDSVTVDLTENDYGGRLFVGHRPAGEILEQRQIPRP